MQHKVKIVLVDDNINFLDGLEALLSQYSHFNVVAKFNSGLELLEYKGLATVDLILMDIEMPGLDGCETAIIIDFKHKEIKKIAISMYQDSLYLEKLVSSGFRGFVSKTRVTEELFEVINRVMRDELVFPHYNIT
jgi:DNA-binding NarL/FixJ family response regulator